MNILKDSINKIKDKITKTDLQRKLKEATSNEHCHANVSLLEEIANKTSNYNDFQIIVAHCIKKLSCKKEKWRKILKTLFLIEHILKVGASNFIDSMKSEIYKIKNLNSFSYIDTNRSDKGETIREKSKYIITLLEDRSKLKDERDNYSKWKSRIEGVSSSGKIAHVNHKSYANNANSVSNSGSVSNSYRDIGIADVKNNKKGKEDSSSSSSESENKNKNKGKNKKVKEDSDESSEEVEKPKNSNKKNNNEFQNYKDNIKKNIKTGNSGMNIKKPGRANTNTNSTVTNMSESNNILFDPFSDIDSNQKQNKINQPSNTIGFEDIFGGNNSTPVSLSNSNNYSPFDIFKTNPNQPNSGLIDWSNSNQINPSQQIQPPQNVNQTKTVDTKKLLQDMYSQDNSGPQNLGGFQNFNSMGSIPPMSKNILFNENNSFCANYPHEGGNNHTCLGLNCLCARRNNQMGNFNNPYVGNNHHVNNYGLGNVSYMPSHENAANTNNPYNFNKNYPNTFSNPSLAWNKPTSINDDEFKEVEEEDNYKIGNTNNTNNNSKKGGLNSLLENSKLVNLNDLGNKNSKNDNRNNLNFLY